jgi:hypothetical protein
MPRLQKAGVVYVLTMKDEAGRAVEYFVQVGPGARVSCWTTDASDVAALTAAELFAACARKAAQ